MNIERIYIVPAAVLLLVAFSSSVHADCLTSGCHAGMLNAAVVHEPALDDCLACHKQLQETHPVKGSKSFTLVAEGAALCAECHDSMVEEKFVHGPAAMGACSQCHDPHSASEKFLLRQEERQTCFACHTDFAESMQSAAVVHTPVTEEKCTLCHVAHSSPVAGLLKEKMQDLCMTCHDDIGEKLRKAKTKHVPLYRESSCGTCHLTHFSQKASLLPMTEMELCLDCHGKDDTTKSDSLKNIKKDLAGKKHLHGPLQDNQCAVCHDPHGTDSARLLKGNYPSAFYAPYKKGIYDFCLSCHEENLLRFPDTTIYTRFRNGKNNLHYVHSANRQKGRTCRTCHEAHASNWDKLITEEGTPFGSWKIPIRFVLTENGGSCSPGCHQTMKYDRQNPLSYGPEEE